MIVATAGHIDHGKTTLVKALTGVDTDRLPEEKARGISIDLGFAYWQAAQDRSIGFVDVPGHERFIRNMLAGVCGIDFVLLIVAADDGVMPQTIEHLHIVDLLNVTHGVAVITKIDRVAPDRVNEVCSDVRALLATTKLAAIPVLPVSPVTGQGIEELRNKLVQAATLHGQRESKGRNLRYAIDRAFSVAGSGTVVTGTVFTGQVTTGERLVVSPAGTEVRVRGIQKQGKPATVAAAGERCALNLTGTDLAGVTRGDWIVAPAVHAPTQRLDARIHALETEPRPLAHWTPVHLHLATVDVTARVAIRRGESVAPGMEGVIQLILDQPICALNGDRFIVRDQSASRTIGGGVVIDPFAEGARRNRAQRNAWLAALEQPGPDRALAALLECSEHGVDVARFQRTFNLTTDALQALLGAPKLAVVGKEQRIVLLREKVDAVKREAVAALRRFHEASPQAVGADIEKLRSELAPALSAGTFLALLRELADQHALEIAGSQARLPQHVATANPLDEQLWQKLKPTLDGAGFNVPVLRELAAQAGLKEALVKDFLHRKSRTNEVIRVTPERFYPKGTLAQLAAIAQATAASAPGNQFTAAQFRDQTGIGRGLAIEILECLDRLGITQRIGDSRKMRRDFAPILGPATAPAAAPAPAKRPAEPANRNPRR
jgi:selenocysteine-specific elongation factor